MAGQRDAGTQRSRGGGERPACCAGRESRFVSQPGRERPPSAARRPFPAAPRGSLTSRLLARMSLYMYGALAGRMTHDMSPADQPASAARVTRHSHGTSAQFRATNSRPCD